jgi:Na+/proline symporter
MKRQTTNDKRQRATMVVVCRLSFVVLCLVFIANAAYACPVCFGDPSAPSAKGMNAAIWFLLGMVGFVQIGFVALFITFWRRARALRMRRESFHVLEGGLR